MILAMTTAFAGGPQRGSSASTPGTAAGKTTGTQQDTAGDRSKDVVFVSVPAGFAKPGERAVQIRAHLARGFFVSACVPGEWGLNIVNTSSDLNLTATCSVGAAALNETSLTDFMVIDRWQNDAYSPPFSITLDIALTTDFEKVRWVHLTAKDLTMRKTSTSTRPCAAAWQ
jgi:hypothetical protein